MKLIIQIPCLNERDCLPQTIGELPRSVPGIDEIEVLIIDDGSTDGTSDVAREAGAHHIVRLRRNKGLSAAFMAGVEYALAHGADVLVNTDADGQYAGDGIAHLVEPVVAGRADLVVGDRQTDLQPDFSVAKRFLQRWGSWLVRRASGLEIRDTTSGFRAFNRASLLQLFVYNRFSYTLESVIQAGHLGLAIENVAVRTNPKRRESRLFGSIPEYLLKNGPVILRAYNMYWPLRTYGFLAVILLLIGCGLGARFLYYYVSEPGISGHIQSLQVGVGAVVLAFVVGLMGLLGDLIATNRRLGEDLLVRIRRLEHTLQPSGPTQGALGGFESYRTGAKPWRP